MTIQKSFVDVRESGTLYLVATPIGNLEDMTYRAVRILGEVTLIAAEDTRQTRKLLTHFDIQTRLVAYHEHNKRNSGPELVRLLLEGESIAIVSDAGLPAISDPGYDLVCLAIEQGVAVVPIPGANAALSALIASGLPTSQFKFIGFLPRDKKGITRQLDRLKIEPTTLIFYESPHRVEKTLSAMIAVWGDNRDACLARELTKKHEEFFRGTLRQCIEHVQNYPPLGEYCIVVSSNESDDIGSETDPSQLSALWWQSLTITDHVEHYLHETGNKKEAIKLVAADRGVPKRDIYNVYVK